MTVRKKRTRRKLSGQLIDVARVISVGQDRATQEAILRLRDTEGRLIAIRLKPSSPERLQRVCLGSRRRRG